MADWLTIGIRFALYADLMLLFGLPLFGLYALKGPERAGNTVLPFRMLTGWLSVAAMGLSMLGIVAMTAAMAGVPLNEVDRASVTMAISETPMGRAWQARMVALLITLYIAVAIGRRKTPTWLVLISFGSAAALGSLAWTGHGAASQGVAGTQHLVADIVHLLAAGAWLGALAALAALLFRPVGRMPEGHLQLACRALQGFSAAGTVIVVLIIVSGLVNGWMLIGLDRVLELPTSHYGQLLIVKLALFATMLGLAAANRFRLTPAFDLAIRSGGVSSAIGLLRRSLIAETGAALAILGIVAWLGTLEPPVSM